MADVIDNFSEHNPGQTPSPSRVRRSSKLVAYAVILVLVTVVATLKLAETEPGSHERAGVSDGGAAQAPRPNHLPLGFGEHDVMVDTETVSAGPGELSLLEYDVEIENTPTAAPRAAMVSFRVECHSGGERAAMQSTGKTSTNVLLAHGGSVSGQALTAATDGDLECNLLASAPYIEIEDDGLSSLELNADLQTKPTDGAHVLALHRLDDATLVRKGSALIVLSQRLDDPETLDQMSTTVRLTSCTVVGGSRDGSGENKCTEAMTRHESSTVRARVIARWLDAEGNIESTTTLWDETLAIDHDTHHIPWTLRQAGLNEKVPDDASAVVLVVQVDSIAGTPFVVHAAGTDSVITTSP